MPELFKALFGWFGLVVLFPFTAIIVVTALWRRLLRDGQASLKRNPPYASIAGFVLCGWYSYLTISFIVLFSNLVPFFNFSNNPAITQQQIVGDIFCILVAILCAFAGQWLAGRMTRHFIKP